MNLASFKQPAHVSSYRDIMQIYVSYQAKEKPSERIHEYRAIIYRLMRIEYQDRVSESSLAVFPSIVALHVCVEPFK